MLETAMTARWTIVLGILLAAGGSAHAGFWTGNELKARLEQYERAKADNVADVDGHTAAGYVVGVTDALDGISVCPPDRVTVGQVISIVEKFVRENPQILNLSADEEKARSSEVMRKRGQGAL
jgi:hypothetical protein